MRSTIRFRVESESRLFLQLRVAPFDKVRSGVERRLKVEVISSLGSFLIGSGMNEIEDDV